MTLREFRSVINAGVEHITVYGVCKVENENTPVLIETDDPYDGSLYDFCDCRVIGITAPKKNHFEVSITNL